MTDNAEKRKRWWEYAKKQRLFCRDYHYAPKTNIIPEWGFFRCGHWMRDEKRECGLWTFQASIGGAGGGGGVLLVEVYLEELIAVERLTTPTEVFDYLNVFPPFGLSPPLRKARRLP